MASEDGADHGVGNGITEASFNDFLGEEAQGPAVMTSGCRTAGKCGNLGALRAIDGNRAAGARRIKEAVKTRGSVLIAQSGKGNGGQVEGSSNVGEGLAAVEFEQSSGALEGFGGERAFGEQRLELVTLRGGESEMLFLHP